MPNTISILDANPLEHITSDIAISQYNYESIMNGLVAWETSKMDTITIRLATNTDPYFVDYTIKTKYAYDTKSGVTVSSPVLPPNSFAYGERLKFSAMYDPTGDNNDTVNIRVNSVNSGDITHRLFAEAAVYSEIDETDDVYTETTEFKHSYVAGLYFKRSISNEQCRLYKTIADIAIGDAIEPGVNCVPLVIEYNGSEYDREQVATTGQFVIYNGNVYRVSSDISIKFPPDNTESGYERWCPVYDETAEYAYGEYVFYNGEFFVHSSDTSTKTIPPVNYDEDSHQLLYMTKYWTSTVLIDTLVNVAGSTIVRWPATTDAVAFVLRNVSSGEPTDEVDIKMTPSLNVKGVTSTQKKGVNIIGTSNFTRYPLSSIKWREGRIYGPTDSSKGVYDLQDYSAIMIFNHADPETSKLNIINYDGPDLDQGLAIFLPVDVKLDDGSISEPADGYEFEFLFRIWPNPELNGNTVNDMIINKAQIYVYNLTDYTDFSWTSRSFDSKNVYPIARFSMARLTNFYVFAENIGVPDKPVVYKARFIYSKEEHCWKTFDYYQFPDHVFMSPAGFVDPMDANSEAYPGVETGGFPLFQDPFAGTNLVPIKVTDEYMERIQGD